MTSQSTIPIDHIAERLSTAHLWIECAESDIQRGNLQMLKRRLERIRELLDAAEQSIDEELAMPTAKECSGGQLSSNPLQFKYPVIKDSLTTQISEGQRVAAH